VFPVEIGLRDPRSQKRDLGHPSVSPFDIAESTRFVLSLPTRSQRRILGMTKERATFLWKVVSGRRRFSSPWAQPPLSK
jgi:predicted transcriptional regulator